MHRRRIRHCRTGRFIVPTVSFWLWAAFTLSACLILDGCHGPKIHRPLAPEIRGPVQDLVGELQAILTGRRDSRVGSTTPPQTVVATPSVIKASPWESAAPTDTAATSKSHEATIVFPEVLDSAAAEVMRRQILSAIDSQAATIRLDLRNTRDLDVQGLALLASVPRYLADHSHSPLQTAGVSIEMATVLRVTGLDESFGVLRGATRETE